MSPNDADGMANSVDPVRLLLEIGFIQVCNICSDLSTPILEF